ncbi:MAG TPA: nitrate reductase [Campylobacterales bacterium]|jgi:nitrate reductase NapD|nr:nitrate reductase [Campylobacterales bacterium]HHH51689.1 nitrate reductase [Campylobacterales bacterium]
MNISSVVVQAPSKYIDELVELFKEADYCDYHLHDKATGKIIVTIEGEGVEDEIKKLVKIQELPQVMAADMMMTYQEEQLDEEIKLLNEQDLVPDVLKREDIDVKDIVYNGDLKKKDFLGGI